MPGTDSERLRLILRVVYEDPPDMIEIEAQVVGGRWAGAAEAYADPTSFREAAVGLRKWAERPSGDFVLEAGDDDGYFGWIHLRWVSNDGHGSIPCYVQLSTGALATERRWRLSLTVKAEPWALERFASQLTRVSHSLDSEAVLECLTTGPGR